MTGGTGMLPYAGVVGLLRDEVEEWVRVGAREGEFRVDEEAVEEDLSLREKRPIVDVVVVSELDGEWDCCLLLSWGRGLAGRLKSRRDVTEEIEEVERRTRDARELAHDRSRYAKRPDTHSVTWVLVNSKRNVSTAVMRRPESLRCQAKPITVVWLQSPRQGHE
jgi:hypothetical protein